MDSHSQRRPPRLASNDSPTVFLSLQDRNVASAVSSILSQHGYRLIDEVATAGAGLEESSPAPQVAILDAAAVQKFADFLAPHADDADGPATVLVLYEPDLEAALEAVRRYAADVVLSPVEPQRMLAAVELAGKQWNERKQERSQRERTLLALRELAGHAATAVRAFKQFGDSESGEAAAPLLDAGSTIVRVPHERMNSTEAVIRKILRMKALRQKHFPTESLDDEMWDMLLHLAQARIDDSKISVSVLGFTVGVPDTTALRKIRELETLGLVKRVSDPRDKRRSNLELVDEAFQRIKTYLDEVARPA
jgi:DNA-binding MarR family transcriptional regulator/FixJ family two-component response regulator